MFTVLSGKQKCGLSSRPAFAAGAGLLSISADASLIVPRSCIVSGGLDSVFFGRSFLEDPQQRWARIPVISRDP